MVTQQQPGGSRALLISVASGIITGLAAGATLPTATGGSGFSFVWASGAAAAGFAVAALIQSRPRSEPPPAEPPLGKAPVRRGPDYPPKLRRPSLPPLRRLLRRRLPRPRRRPAAAPDPRVPPDWPALPGPRRPPRRVVSSGFATPGDPAKPVPSDRTLLPQHKYCYWFEIGEASVPFAIDAPDHRDLPLTDVAAGTPLTVVLFGFPDELDLVPTATVGELVIIDDGSVRVTRQPGGRPVKWSGRTRLLFPVRTPSRPGRYRLRCNLYCRQTLLQSRLVEAEVTDRPQRMTSALRSSVDYTVSPTLSSELLAATRPLQLSIFLNANRDGTHGFRFKGEKGLTGDAVVGEAALRTLLERARETYRLVGWNSSQEWQREWDVERYAYRRPSIERLTTDLVRMAKAGSALWAPLSLDLVDAVKDQLPTGQSPSLSLTEIMRPPGFVELASKSSLRMVMPASILYDYPLDDDPRVPLQVCPDAMAAIEARHDLAPHPCFNGQCPSYDSHRVVCPGGFWGFRHRIGLPQSRQAEATGDPSATAGPDSGSEIYCLDLPEFVIAVADEFRGDHVGNVHKLGNSRSRVAENRTDLLTRLRAKDFGAHIVYFFCHGEVRDGEPALLIGPDGDPGITHTTIDNRMWWGRSRPLVVLNGCQTAALEPGYAFNLVEAFIRRAHASGVIGTETTVFTSLASRFADEFFQQFLSFREPIGEAVRRARLRLLTEGNPLGLLYIAYAAPWLRFIPAEG